jgi:protein required for attachment to host cells
LRQPKRRILVVAADAGAARWFECARLGGPLRQVGEKTKGPDAAQRDRPFRVHDRFGAARHAVEARRLPRSAAEERFLAEVAQAIALEKFDALVLCAPPKALGVLRERLPESVRDRIILASAKDYLRETPSDLAMRLEELALKSKGQADRG